MSADLLIADSGTAAAKHGSFAGGLELPKSSISLMSRKPYTWLMELVTRTKILGKQCNLRSGERAVNRVHILVPECAADAGFRMRPDGI